MRATVTIDVGADEVIEQLSDRQLFAELQRRHLLDDLFDEILKCLDEHRFDDLRLAIDRSRFPPKFHDVEDCRAAAYGRVRFERRFG